MIQAWLNGYKNIFRYSGRERRRTFGFFVLFHFILLFVLLFVLAPIMGKLSYGAQEYVAIIFLIVWFLPLLSAMVRRCHDNNTTGWILLIGVFMLAVTLGALLVLPSRPGEGKPNKYGSDPNVHMNF